MEKVLVLIVGAGPSDLAVAACLSELSIPYCIIEREDCSASLWRKRTYDRLKLHLAKEFCELPHMSYPSDTPTSIPKEQFVRYVDAYVDHFNIFPKYSTSVESCKYDEVSNCWDVMAHDKVTGLEIEYTTRFLVVATGENSEGIIPEIPGLHDFPGEVIHSSSYKSWNNYVGKGVLVVGCGNSGMEIAYDLASHGVETSVVIRSPLHVMTKGLINLGMKLFNWRLPLKFVDFILVTFANIRFGDLSKYGIVRPNMGPLLLKAKTGRSAVIDVGTIELIKKGFIKVLCPISRIRGNSVEFGDAKECSYDSIVFATGHKSTANTWLKNGESMLNNNGMPKREFPNHWKGENGLYCVGLAMKGLAGISHDAKSVAADIKSIVDSMGPF
ncbi:putative indole-3-pyruvate monooxygenase YUCCA11 [Panicum miliaceum]|uniref:indole-3-pyruvate monooxygenase n=1 Tax=Panicum miliaceum TaxID=4540 RepID=A0A3L6T5S5_PANMI|nr:putative indole-3-pyruvate monooxygenase YUCCA11 [Panicum miliaceum]